MIKNLVTIYITNFNYANYIEKAIKSCLNQTYKKIEIITNYKILNFKF